MIELVINGINLSYTKQTMPGVFPLSPSGDLGFFTFHNSVIPVKKGRCENLQLNWNQTVASKSKLLLLMYKAYI